MATGAKRPRADLFSYRGVEVRDSELIARFDLDGTTFSERVVFEGVGHLVRDDVRRLGDLWAFIAGLSYYKAGAAQHVDLGNCAVGPAGRALLAAALVDGLGEFAFRNDLDLSDVTITGGRDVAASAERHDPTRVLTPFGGGIDSVVSVTTLPSDIEQRLFIVSPTTGRFAPLEATAAVTGLDVARVTRTLDPKILERRPDWFNGHVPVSAMITLLAAIAAVADGRGGVVMSCEHSSSVPNLVHRGRDVNHQWSKSWAAELLLREAIAECMGPSFASASLLRSRSELWVAEQFSHVSQYHHVFRSCNRAYAQRPEDRASNWCGECDKCLFIHLVLAPFMDRDRLRSFLGVEPLADPARREQLRTLVGLGQERKPFECVGDPAECAVALRTLAAHPQWRDEPLVVEFAPLLSPDETLAEMLAPRGVSGAPASWIR